jgi:hypothetical protein
MMRNRRLLAVPGLILAIGIGLTMALGGGRTIAKPAPKYKYPEPRFPSYLKQPKTVDDLMPSARAFTTIKQGNQGYGLGNFNAGDTLLLVPDVTAEPLPLEAVRRALEERGIKVVVKSEADMVGLTHDDAEEYRRVTVIPSAKQGYLEARNYWMDETPRVWPHPDVAKDWLKKKRPDIYDALWPKEQEITPEFAPKAAKMRSPSVGNAIREYLIAHPETTALYWGKPGGGFSGPRALGDQINKLKGPTTFANSWVLASAIPTFPSEVAHLIEKRTLDRFTLDIDRVHVTDAEGTDVTWDVTPEMAKRWEGSFYDPAHLLLYPDTATGKHGDNIDQYPVHNKEWTPREPIARINGVIAGTNGSGGFYPRMVITYKDGYMTDVKGGGIYGDVIRTFRQYPHINDTLYPYYDQPGFWHVWELALGTMPKNFRNPSDFYGGGHTGIYCLTFERYRAGIFHWGFGNEIPDEEGSVGQPVRWNKFGADHNLPVGHDFHVHNYFSTYQIHNKSTNTWVTIVDKGHLVTLDDPEVRAAAAKYGDPDKLLNEDWIPEVPGINAPGSYEDYSKDPWKYTDPQMQKILHGTYQYFYPPVAAGK